MFEEEEGVNVEPIAEVQDVVQEQEPEEEYSSVEEQSSEETSEVAEPKQEFKTDDNAKYAAARRESEKKVKEMEAKQNSFAKGYGYDSFDEMQRAQQEQTYIDQGVSPEIAKQIAQQKIALDSMQDQINKSRIAEEKSKLQNQKYFKDLEPELDSILEANPNLSTEFVFNYVRGQKMEELIAKEAKAAAQRQLNNINGKSHMKTESGGSNDIVNIAIDEQEFAFMKRLDPSTTRESYAKFIKSQRG